MEEVKLEVVVNIAIAAADHARDTRAAYRKRVGRDDRQRQSDIGLALHKLKMAMVPVRAELARIPYQLRAEDNPRLREQRALLLDTSDALQRERRKLWKMRQPRSKHARGRRR